MILADISQWFETFRLNIQVDNSSAEVRRQEGGRTCSRRRDYHGGQSGREAAHHVRR
jgi:hypothetical protein